ncbi:MAG: chitobiase/beta-hexosaminidase C-terminal domain-containing protein [Lachnospiraceae bacterium]|jgi:tetratricopeptide (TPR) repeat protein|nr:chitobiase/beta-hexosaminidase C-terminal domain-containing protein [Lachnospiraceae bacterium]
MTCPKCGFELNDEHLICGQCGEEIQIVPDFEPELENSISEAMLTVADEINPDSESVASQQAPDAAGVEAPEMPEAPGAFKQMLLEAAELLAETSRKKRGAVVTILAIVFFSMIIPLSVNAYRSNSVTFQLEQARVYAEAGDYESAMAVMERVAERRSNDINIVFLWTDYCLAGGQSGQAVDILLAAATSPSYTWSETDECYARLVAILDQERDYERIVSVLAATRDEDLIERYGYYFSSPPAFSEESGHFTESLMLWLTAGSAGNIYFTLDGSDPTADSYLYYGPILLPAGDNYVTAVFANEYGIMSEAVQRSYFIDIPAPAPPQVALTSGRYIRPTRIEVNVPDGCTVYYTTDGSVPTSESTIFDQPINMPLGTTYYSFVAINSEGVSSEVVMRTFEYRAEGWITAEMAVANVMRAHFRNGWITDLDGKAAAEEGYYQYVADSVIELADGSAYYLVVEYHVVDGREPVKTGHLFAAAVENGQAAHLVYNEEGVLEAVNL